MNKITMWCIRILSLMLSGGVSAVAIAMLVEVISSSQLSQSQTQSQIQSAPNALTSHEHLPKEPLPQPQVTRAMIREFSSNTFKQHSSNPTSTLPRVSPLLPVVSSNPTNIKIPNALYIQNNAQDYDANAINENSQSNNINNRSNKNDAGNNISNDTGNNNQKNIGAANHVVNHLIDHTINETPQKDPIEETPASTQFPSSLEQPSRYIPDTSTLLPLNLQDVVILVLENNRSIKNAYLDRIIQQEALAVAKDRFNPNVTPRIIFRTNRNDRGLSTSTQGDFEVGTEMDILFPTGTSLTTEWIANGDIQRTMGQDRGISDGLGQRITIGIRHPLWRNSGSTITRAPLQISRIQDKQDIFRLKKTLIDTITTAIRQYHSLLLAQQQLEIQRQSLVRTENELTRIEALIGAGHLAAIERVEAEADVANRQVDVLDAENGLRNAQLALIQALDIDQNLVPEAVEAAALSAEAIQFAEEKVLVDYALEHNPNYRSSLLNLDVAAIELVQAEDQLQWDLDLLVGYSNNLSSRSAEQSDVRASLQLSREFGDRALKQRVLRQRTRIQQLENTRIEDRENLEISVRNALRDVAFQQTQVEQAEQATHLAELQLESTQVRFRQGNVTFLEVVQSQDNLVNAQNRELVAKISYQNALVSLDRELGHTLETWNIQI